jgi:hypothetical protein
MMGKFYSFYNGSQSWQEKNESSQKKKKGLGREARGNDASWPLLVAPRLVLWDLLAP